MSIDHLVRSLTENEVAQNPHNYIANHILDFSHHLSSTTITFGAIYLTLHGIVKIVLVVAVLKEKLWAYPWLIAFLIVFIVYQIYRLVLHMSLGLSLLTIFDIFIVWLTIIEYKKHKLATETSD